MLDRRKFQRVPYGAWVETEAEDQGLRFFTAVNLSVGGLLLKAGESQRLPIGTKVRLRLVIENESRVMTVQGEVVRYEADDSFGVRFTNLDPARNAFLKDLVGEMAGKPGEEPPL